MAKRRLSRQQKHRIEAANRARSQSDDFVQGLVVSHRGGLVLVEIPPDGALLECKIKSNLGSLVCGDRVSIETTPQQQYRVSAILDRENLLQRVDGFGQTRAVAANLTRLVVCLAVTPEPNLFLLDQYLLSADQHGIEACIVLNKIDLAAGTEDFFGLRRLYPPLGYRVIETSVKTGIGKQQFENQLRGQVSVLSGVSGVGKSSLTNWLLPGENIKIAALSAANEEGRHTTRASRLYHLAGGGDLVDTPGVRGFSPYIDQSIPLASGFREISEHGQHCRFHNCLHRSEPGCAVQDALAADAIAASRYQSYIKMLEQSDGAGQS